MGKYESLRDRLAEAGRDETTTTHAEIERPVDPLPASAVNHRP